MTGDLARMLLAATLSLLVTATDGGAVESSREVFLEVEAAKKAGSLTKKVFRDCASEFSTFETWTDAAGVVRLLVWEFGSEDSAHRAENYFDANGKLRFLFVKVGAVPDAHVEARWWFDDAGKIAQKKRKVSGEGPTYYANEPGEYRVTSPAAFVSTRTKCKK
ncbi:MAG: hypothetical protein JNM17_00325 [Archangium sp.]|nr:hypothetical protein [Archangium sp.]